MIKSKLCMFVNYFRIFFCGCVGEEILFFLFQDQFDTIDLSDNEIKKLEGFPLLRRLKSILASNNKIWWAKECFSPKISDYCFFCCLFCSRIAEGLEQSLPQLETLVLTNNNLEKLVHNTGIHFSNLFVLPPLVFSAFFRRTLSHLLPSPHYSI